MATHSSSRPSVERLLGLAHLRKLVFGEQAGLDPHGEFDLFGRVQKRDLTDLLQVVLDRVRGSARDGARVDGDLVLVVDERKHERALRQLFFRLF